jgi:hypothetical protein
MAVLYLLAGGAPSGEPAPPEPRLLLKTVAEAPAETLKVAAAFSAELSQAP